MLTKHLFQNAEKDYRFLIKKLYGLRYRVANLPEDDHKKKRIFEENCAYPSASCLPTTHVVCCWPKQFKEWLQLNFI